MISRRLAGLTLGLLAMAGCHQDPTVVTVTVAAFSDSFTLDASGGITSVPAGVVATAGSGGSFQAQASGAINFGSGATIPPPPALPSPPTVGTELTPAMIGTTVAGNIFISSTLQIVGGANPATIMTNSGDIVISGTLIAATSAGTTTNAISISAPAGTIYVLGSIVAAGTPSLPDNPNGGAVTLTASRIVLTGTIDTSGESEAAAAGGFGGDVLLDTTAAGGGFIFFTGGSIVTAGGGGTTSGGHGGAVTLQAGTQLAVYAPITTSGGAANSPTVSPLGGKGGAVTLTGNGGVDVVSTLLMTGGSSTGTTDGAIGGGGGLFSAGATSPHRIYGAILTTGGSATANTVGAGAVTAGNGGGVIFGGVTFGAGPRVSSLEIGLGTYSLRGGEGAAGGGPAGTFSVESIDGDVAVSSSLVARGGDCVGPGSGNGGAGGSILLQTDANAAGNLSNHMLSMPSFGTLLDSSGGTPFGGNGGAGQAITLQSGGDLTFGGRIVSSGGTDSVSGAGGGAGAVQLLINAANTLPSGNLIVGSFITAEGGLPTSAAAGGNGGNVNIGQVKAGSLGAITFSATLSTAGGGNGAGGNAGSITISSIAGSIDLSGSLSAPGRSALSAAGAGGNLSVSTAGSISSSAVIVLDGGSGQDSSSGVAGANAGTLTITSSGPNGFVTLLPGTFISASGGSATVAATGGTGGRVLLSTVNQAVSITGSITAVGGPSATGAGGLGGQVVVNSDSNGDGIGGAITLTAGSGINVSGGSGTVGGSARNNGGVAPADSSGTLTLCVIFDASGGLTASTDGATEGIVQNLGTIIANGGSPVARGGDVWFDGMNALAVPLTAADGGSLTLSGALGSGVFFPN